jgi:hypothetical protein
MMAGLTSPPTGVSATLPIPSQLLPQVRRLSPFGGNATCRSVVAGRARVCVWRVLPESSGQDLSDGLPTRAALEHHRVSGQVTSLDLTHK